MKAKSTPADHTKRIAGLEKDLTDAVGARLKAESDHRLAGAEIKELKAEIKALKADNKQLIAEYPVTEAETETKVDTVPDKKKAEPKAKTKG